MVLEIWKNQEAEMNGQAQDGSSWTEHFLSPVIPAELWKTPVISVFCSSFSILYTNKALKLEWFIFEDQLSFRP